MRTIQKKQEYQNWVVGIIKDIAFHEMYMEKFRTENSKNKEFDCLVGYKMIDTFKCEKIDAYEIQGFLDKNGHKYTQNECKFLITGLNKSALFLDPKMFMDLCLPEDQQLRSESVNRNDKIKVSVQDFDYWTRIQKCTQAEVIKMFIKQIQFYVKIEQSRQTFCREFYGDIYTVVNCFSHKTLLYFEDIYKFLKQHDTLFNREEYNALVRRTTSGEREKIKKQQLVDLFVTKCLNVKPTIKKKLQYNPNRFSYMKQNRENKKSEIDLLKQKVLSMEDPKQLQYNYYSPYQSSIYGIHLYQFKLQRQKLQTHLENCQNNQILAKVCYSQSPITTNPYLLMGHRY